MTSPGLFFWQDKIGKTNPHVVDFTFQITAAKTITNVPVGTPVLTSFDAIASQSVINDFLGTTDEFLVAAFDATAMGTDAFACIVNMAGQVDDLFKVEYYIDDGSTHADVAKLPVATLTASSLSTQCAKGAYGNMALRLVYTGLDALTSGIICIRFYFKSK
jgi:hypothetical protein